MGTQIVHSQDANFSRDVLESTVPVLVDFWAAWCGPCHMIAPGLEEIAKEYEGRLKVVKIDVDNNPKTAGEYGIMSIPTLILFKDGKNVGKMIGAAPKPQIIKFLSGHIPG